MTRIIAGLAGGRVLRTPPGPTTRPTSDRVREALFSMLEAADAVDGAQVLDLFAGSGALGLEALSRGAARAVLVDRARPALEAVRANVRALGLAGAEVVGRPVAAVLAGPPLGHFDLVLVDPPYDLAETELAAVLIALVDGGWTAPGALVVVERSSRTPPPAWPPGLLPERERRYGETVLWPARRAQAPSEPE